MDGGRRFGPARIAGIVLMLLGLVSASAAVLLIGYNEQEADQADRRAQAVVRGVRKQVLEFSQDTPFTPDYVLDPTRDMPAVEVDGVRYVGVLEIPALELSLPVVEDWSYDGLRIGPCRYNGTAYRVGFAICAHNYKRHFGQLETLDPGERIYFTDGDGNRFGYVIRTSEILQPTDVDRVTESDWPLTLFTCTISGQTRYALRCDRLEGETGFE